MGSGGKNHGVRGGVRGVGFGDVRGHCSVAYSCLGNYLSKYGLLRLFPIVLPY
jgi:hypothetical protein